MECEQTHFQFSTMRSSLCTFYVWQGQEGSRKDSVKSQKCFFNPQTQEHRPRNLKIQQVGVLPKCAKWLTHAIIGATIIRQNNMPKLKRNVRKTWEDSTEPVRCQFQNQGWKEAGNTLYETKIYKCSHSSSCQAKRAPRAKAQLPLEKGALQMS